ncbi:MAG: hypothetical protein R2746_04325 [Acidimicrobiales bacterium]
MATTSQSYRIAVGELPALPSAPEPPVTLAEPPVAPAPGATPVSGSPRYTG